MGPNAVVRLVTVIVGIVVGLTFLFGLGNVATLSVRLRVPTYVAFLVAPAVDLSVVGLLLGTRHLALHGGPAEVVRSGRCLLIFSSMVKLALNIAEPLIAGHYGKAAFDAVGPLLLIGWSEVGPSLLQAMQATSRWPRQRGPRSPHAAYRRSRVWTCAAADTVVGQAVEEGEPTAGASSRDDEPAARTQDLLHRTRAEDVLHWQQYQRPISAETLRKRLRIGAGTARSLVMQPRW